MAIEEELIITPRREFLLKAVNFEELKGLEIGALNEPLVKKKDVKERGEIFYLDHLATDELKEKYKDDISVEVDEIVSVDFVCRDGNIVKATSGEMFDYVIASHVVEHAPNLLQFLKDIHEILKPGGHCILIIPDKRFTFDLNRPVTTFGAVLEKFLFRQETPSVSAVYDHFATAVEVNGHDIWYGKSNVWDPKLLVSEAFAWDAARRVKHEDKYFDVHINIFTPHSFFEILKKAFRHKIFSFVVENFTDTKVAQIEFMVSLKKPEIEFPMRKCIDAIPKLPLESIFAPYMPQVRALSSALENIAEVNRSLQNELHQSKLMIEMHLNEKAKIQEDLSTAHKVLGRRSVKLVITLMHMLFGTFRKKS